ncbi:HD domain-containing protein [Candidatus Fermentibacteria bacterium]|nr:HD domain-containing protein [Candidatus Fermentibacteria bacterium]
MLAGSSPEARRRFVARADDARGPYFRDQTAIIHSSPFRRLKHKTQVFFAPRNDHICTRIEHVLHVATIGATICKGLNAKGFSLDPELAEAIGLGHDVGHAPFGHTGEEILDSLAEECGGFVHEIHSLRVLDCLCNGGKGLNLTYAVRDGVLFHCGERFEQSLCPREEPLALETVDRDRWLKTYPITWEGCAVRMADKVAYLGRDVEDAVEAGIIELGSVPAAVRANLGTRNGEIIDAFVVDLIGTSSPDRGIALSEQKYDLMRELFAFSFAHIYRNERLLAYHEHCERILKWLFQFLLEFEADELRRSRPRLRLEEVYAHYRNRYAAVHDAENAPASRRVIDFMAGMTDLFVLDSMAELSLPTPLF